MNVHILFLMTQVEIAPGEIISNFRTSDCFTSFINVPVLHAERRLPSRMLWRGDKKQTPIEKKDTNKAVLTLDRPNIYTIHLL